MKSDHILFIHIPKTAGTSFRIAAEEFFGKDKTFYDYSPQSSDTSKEILSAIYVDNDPFKLYSTLMKLEKTFFSGHFLASKYCPLYDTLNVVSFMRDPVEQVVSHYNHFRNYHKYEKNISDFILEPRFRNIQSNYLAGKPLALYGFIGLTEEYRKSIDIFNSLYGTELNHKYINVKLEDSLSSRDLSKELLQMIKRVNFRDIELYESVRQQFAVRQKLYDDQLPYTYGFVQRSSREQISGLAFQKDYEEAVEIDIFSESIYLGTVRANVLRAGQMQRNIPRKGFVGFDFIYRGKQRLDEKLRAIVKKTGQEIL